MSAPRTPSHRPGGANVGRPRPEPLAHGNAERAVPLSIADERANEPARWTGGELLPRPRSEVVSRVMNVVVALLAIVVAAPLFVLVALAVKLTSPGPVFYTQTRVGLERRRRPPMPHLPVERRREDLGGKPFTIFKFRSMCVNAEPNGAAVWASQNDLRVTPVGRFLRRSRLDELPQLFNVLLGDMNVVGPRPERPSILAKLRLDIEEYPLRQLVKPGITGWSQINQQYDTCIADVRRKVRFDLEYVRRQSALEDLRIMVRTIPVVLFRRGGW